MSWFYFADLAGVAVFAVAGTLLAFRKEMDPFGALVLASVTAIGGGTTRDLILNQPVFWVYDPIYFAAIFAAIILTAIWLRFKAYIPLNQLLYADALGLAIFTVLGAEKALQLELSPVIAVIMGTMTAVFGGMLRDVLARDIPMVLKRDLYATTTIAGGIVFVLLYPWHPQVALMVSIVTTSSLRFAAIRYHWSLPVLKKIQR